jgi:hypothetical protein
MEKEGLIRVFRTLDAERIKVTEIVTDRHASVRKWLRELHPEIPHFFDCWHLDKGSGFSLVIYFQGLLFFLSNVRIFTQNIHN